ncbi:MAG: VOC family protein [Planctomycetes bacterium]|nr:VOC family protein [Planctomycetota bacterium]
MIKKIAFVAYPTKKIEESKRFWGELLGLKHKFDHTDDKGGWSEYDTPDQKSIAIDGFSPAGSRAYLALETDDIEAEIARLKEAGVPIHKDIWDNEVCKMALIEDPEGNLLMIHQISAERAAAAAAASAPSSD